MAVAQSVPSFPLSSLDRVLEKIAEKLQLTSTAYSRAKRSYEAIGDMLDSKNSPLARYRPKIYPQGSVRIGTTVRPWGREEYDVDLVCELQISKEARAMAVLDLVQQVLESDETYKSIVQRKNRCLRLNYAGDFHLDVLPACPDPEQAGGTAILVPDCKLQNWTPSNPEGYAKWVDKRADLLKALLAEKAAQFPTQQPVEAKPILKITVQLFKRWRDIKFQSTPQLAPVSVVLTTLAATHYRGEQSVPEALETIVTGIVNSLPVFGRLIVQNPTNDREDFSERWNDQQAYMAFVNGIREFRNIWLSMKSVKGLHNLKPLLEQLFGESLADTVIKEEAEEFNLIRDKEALGIVGTTGFLTHRNPASGSHVPRHTYHGK